jgi:hypothetical protein
MGDRVVNLPTPYRKPPSSGGTEPPDMDILLERVDGLDADMRDVRDRLVRVESKLDTFATKADLHHEINSQTWKLVTFVCGFGTALVAAVYYIATHV